MAQMHIIGVQKVQGIVDGNSFNFSRVYAVAMLDPSKENSKGYAGIEMRAIPAISDKYLNYSFKREGILFEVEIDKIAAGKGEFKDVITAMVPVAEMQQAKSAVSSAVSPRAA
jgi:hypothetical protein